MSARGTSEAIGSVIAAAVVLAGVVALTICLSLLWAFVIHQLWGWFAVPLGAPVLAVVHIWGLMILKGMLTWKQPAEDQKANWSLMITYPLIAWGLGALAAWWMA